MRELRSFGSVRGEGSDALAYSENRPTAAGGHSEVIATNRPFAACDRLTALVGNPPPLNLIVRGNELVSRHRQPLKDTAGVVALQE
jgi:hypothetical protein